MRQLLALVLAAALLGVASATTPVSPADRLAASPDLAIAGDGTLYLLWVDTGPRAAAAAAAGGMNHDAALDVVLARSDDGGATFSAPVRVNPQAGSVWSFPSARPELAVAAPGTVHVFYTINAKSPANGKPVLAPMYARSTDRGKTFSAGLELIPIPDGDLSHFMHGGFAQAETFGTVIAWGRNVAVVWIDTRHMRSEADNGALFSALSTDDGASFAPARTISVGDICPCCQVTAAVSGDALLIGERRVEDGYRDSHVAVSTDGGRSFGTPLRLGTERWKIDGCPLKPTVLAAAGDSVYAAAFNAAGGTSGIRWAMSTDGGRSFGPFDRLVPEAAVSDAPALVATDGGVTALWHGKLAAGDQRSVFMRASADRGKTWSAPRALSSPGVEAAYPAAVARQDGSIVAAWLEGDRVVTAVLDRAAR